MKEYLVLKDFRGSPDGRMVNQYYSGEVHLLNESLAKTALGEGWVVAPPSEPKEKQPKRKLKLKRSKK